MLFRQHRGNLSESMKTLVELKDKEALVLHCQGLVDLFFTFEPDELTVELSSDKEDARIGWKQTYFVIIKNFGVIGMTDSPS
jgi:hypothetical protein